MKLTDYGGITVFRCFFPFVQVDDSDYLVHVGYSYWTLCYVITLEGAKKLLDGEPLGKMLPVDEYLPIMFDRHPDVSSRTDLLKNWKIVLIISRVMIILVLDNFNDIDK